MNQAIWRSTSAILLTLLLAGSLAGAQGPDPAAPELDAQAMAILGSVLNLRC